MAGYSHFKTAYRKIKNLLETFFKNWDLLGLLSYCLFHVQT